MRQLELFLSTSEREVQPRQRVAASRVANSAYGEVTNHVKPEETRYWAVTQVKELSTEILNVAEAEGGHLTEGSSLATAKRQRGKNLTRSETPARYQKEKVGTRETQSVPHEYRGVCVGKPIDGKLMQKTLWEADQSIVVMKQGNACGAKGLAVMGKGRQGHFLHTQRWTKEVNKTVFPLRTSSGESAGEVHIIGASINSGFSQRVLQRA